jgi:hypothetical protein
LQNKTLLEYGGVFISDVVGLGKTSLSAMLAGQLDGRTLVIAPQVLIEKSNPMFEKLLEIAINNQLSKLAVIPSFETWSKSDADVGAQTR